MKAMSMIENDGSRKAKKKQILALGQAQPDVKEGEKKLE
jgi:hypothetical protein